VPRLCEVCGSNFMVQPYVLRKGWGRFCSLKCSLILKRDQAKQSRSVLQAERAASRISAPLLLDGALVCYVTLSSGTQSIVDIEDLALVKQCRWSVRKGGYAYSKLGSLHRLILNPPDDLQVDHINGNRLDNRRCNLRAVTCAQNHQGFRSPDKRGIGIRGVNRTRYGRFEACVKASGVRHWLGTFATAEEASAAVEAERALIWASYEAYK
jgi:hypothetical protein